MKPLEEMSDILVTTAEDGSRWVMEEDYQQLFEVAQKAEATLSEQEERMAGIRASLQLAADTMDIARRHIESRQVEDKDVYETLVLGRYAVKAALAASEGAE